ncbi:hypothetical protein EG347_15010 [Chryseobacterium sp. G0186]|uniref:TnsA endonuclease N-terminal domain-containing protein n=1 Tax=Chryseobacterium sp. G0186 TaxID=2487064 RepID=UPI000F5158A2|nr:TnsA endonuclease N-terminal domain-containing protein [Chryseobacterium sp. G0186]AZA78721.1 hypothetical protein EG347_15010 [Chryseobacterium sp. G0186]
MRKIGLTYRSLSGIFFSTKNNRGVQFESSLERDFLYMLEMDQSVVSFLEQPFTLKYRDARNKVRRYTPDFLYHIKCLKSSKSFVIEIKYQEDLEKNFDIYVSKFEAAKAFCEENNYEFKILNEKDIRNDYLLNCKFLHGYKYNKVDPKEPFIELLLVNINQLGVTTPRKLIEFSCQNIDKQMELIYYIWYMISTHKIQCLWSVSITMDSNIWATDCIT